jgi:hypothetical protein
VKIIQCSNFDRKDYPEKLIASGIETMEHATVMTRALVAKFCTDDGPDYFRVVEDNYVLSKGFEP